jgi:hypothetical protein
MLLVVVCGRFFDGQYNLKVLELSIIAFADSWSADAKFVLFHFKGAHLDG